MIAAIYAGSPSRAGVVCAMLDWTVTTPPGIRVRQGRR